jgi:hypothetical protein
MMLGALIVKSDLPFWFCQAHLLRGSELKIFCDAIAWMDTSQARRTSFADINHSLGRGVLEMESKSSLVPLLCPLVSPAV